MSSILKTMFLKTVVFCACVAVASAEITKIPLEPKPEKFKNDEGCYIKEMDTVIQFGASAPSKNNCSQYRCRSDYVEIETCREGYIYEPNDDIDRDYRESSCAVVTIGGEPFPGCCPTYRCLDILY